MRVSVRNVGSNQPDCGDDAHHASAAVLVARLRRGAGVPRCAVRIAGAGRNLGRYPRRSHAPGFQHRRQLVDGHRADRDGLLRHLADRGPLTSADTTLLGISLNVDAPAYALTNNSSYRLKFTGTGIVVNGRSLLLINDGIVVFSGTSTAGRSTIENFGVVQFEDSSTAGSAAIYNGCCLLFSGQSSAGVATITNDGDIAFSGQSTAGAATITNNALIEFFDSSTAGNATIINNGGILFAETSSAGSATITNNDTLVFMGSSTAGNATIVNYCCLMFFDASTAGNATIVTQNGGSTYFSDSASGGSARFVVNAGGVLDFTGLTTAGTTAGSVEGAGSILLDDKRLTVGSLGTSTIFSGAIDGVGGSLVKVGSGSLTLSGANTYTGPTIVDAGKLIVNGSIVSNVTVNAGGELGGTGQVGGLALQSGAVHAPGNSIGTQTVNGNYTNFGTLQIEANAQGQSDRVIVNGGVDITGAILRVLAQAGVYGPTQSYLVIQNDGPNPVLGGFGSLTSSLPYLIATVTTTGGDGNDVVLTLTRNDALITDAARTPNQRAVAGALRNGFASEAGSPGAVVINTLLMLSPDDTRKALDALSGEIHASLVHALFAQSRYLIGMASDRLWSIGQGAGIGGGVPWAAGGQQQMMGLGLAPTRLGERESARAPSRAASWVRGYGGFGSIDGDGNAAQFESRTGGLLAGGDMVVAPGLVAGLMGGWGTSETDVDARRSSAGIDSSHVAAYARAALGNVQLEGVAAYSHHDIDVIRHIAFTGLARTAASSYAADQATLYGEAGWRLRFGGGLEAMPWTGLYWSGVSVQDFAEQGADAIDLLSDGASYTMLDAIAGVRLATSVAAAGVTWMPQARLAWTHSFGDIDPRLDLAFRNGGAFVVSGVRRNPNLLALGAGLNVFDAGAASGFIDYTAFLSGDSREHAATAGLRVQF
jgi:outer membrane autotransporter protein